MFPLAQIVGPNPGFKLTALPAAIIAMSVNATSAAASIDETIENALKFGQADAKYGQVKFDLRYRYEYADSKNPQKQAGNASTARLRLGYLTPKFYGFQLYSEYEGNQDIVANDYNSLTIMKKSCITPENERCCAGGGGQRSIKFLEI